MTNPIILIVAVLVTNLITATIVVKTQSCSDVAGIDEAKRAAQIAEMKRIRGDTPPGARIQTVIPGN